jgi:flagella basal body P-ring formation protein FlgA
MKPIHILLGLCIVAPAHAASLRPATTLQGARVYLRDLFDDAGANASIVLGPGPAPGARIVVEARQLKAIAVQYGVDWRPASGGDRAVLEWPGHPMKREDVLAVVRTALVAGGAAPGCDVELPGFTPPMIPLAATAAAVVTQLDYDQEQGHFSATLSVTGGGMDPLTMRIAGDVADVVELPVPVTRLRVGAVTGPDDVRMARVHVTSLHAEVVHDPAALIGMQVKRQLSAGVPVAVADLMQPTQVTRGDPVRLQLEVSGLSLTGQGMALESGAAGDLIRVRNISSQAVLEAEVVGPGVVRVLPGTAPITAQARPGLSLARGG